VRRNWKTRTTNVRSTGPVEAPTRRHLHINRRGPVACFPTADVNLCRSRVATRVETKPDARWRNNLPAPHLSITTRIDFLYTTQKDRGAEVIRFHQTYRFRFVLDLSVCVAHAALCREDLRHIQEQQHTTTIVRVSVHTGKHKKAVVSPFRRGVIPSEIKSLSSLRGTWANIANTVEAHALTSTRCCSHRETTRVRTHQQRLRLSDVSNAVPSSPAAQIDERQHNNGAPSTRTCTWWILMLVDRTVRFLCQDASSSLPCIPINPARSIGISTSNSQRLGGVVPLVKEDNGGHGSAFGSRATACRLLSFLCRFRLSRYACVDQELSPRLALFAACPRSSEI
jgi:hypothetical protein